MVFIQFVSVVEIKRNNTLDDILYFTECKNNIYNIERSANYELWDL